jgi:hypothetical protein
LFPVSSISKSLIQAYVSLCHNPTKITKKSREGINSPWTKSTGEEIQHTTGMKGVDTNLRNGHSDHALSLQLFKVQFLEGGGGALGQEVPHPKQTNIYLPNISGN